MKSDISSLIKGSAIYGIGSIISRFISLLLLPIFTSYLSTTEYGVLSMLALLTLVVQPIFSLSLGAAMGPSYFRHEGIDNKSSVVWTAFSISVVSSLCLILLAWILPEFLAQLIKLPVERTWMVSMSLTGTAMTILTTALIQRVQFEKEAKLYVIITLITALVAILVSLVLVVFLNWGAEGIIVGQVASNSLNLLAFFIITVKRTRFSYSSILAKELLRLGLPLIPSFAFLFILMHVNKYILEWHSGLDAVGIYSIGFNLGFMLSIFTGGISIAWYPFFMGYVNKQTEIKDLFGKIFTYYVFGVGLLCLFFFLAASPLIIILTDKSFYDASYVIGLVALANFFQGGSNFFLPGLYYQNEVKYVSVIQGLSAIVSLVVNYFLISRFGLIGAAAGLAGGNFVLILFMWVWNVMKGSKYPPVAYEWKRIGGFCFMFGGIVLANLIFQPVNLQQDILKSITLGFSAIFLLLIMLNKQERYSIISIIKMFQ